MSEPTYRDVDELDRPRDAALRVPDPRAGGEPRRRPRRRPSRAGVRARAAGPARRARPHHEQGRLGRPSRPRAEPPAMLALKEWHVVSEAIARGDQVLTIRKGGIREKEFAVEGAQFWLFPTWEHENAGELQARLARRAVALPARAAPRRQHPRARPLHRGRGVGADRGRRRRGARPLPPVDRGVRRSAPALAADASRSWPCWCGPRRWSSRSCCRRATRTAAASSWVELDVRAADRRPAAIADRRGLRAVRRRRARRPRGRGGRPAGELARRSPGAGDRRLARHRAHDRGRPRPARRRRGGLVPAQRGRRRGGGARDRGAGPARRRPARPGRLRRSVRTRSSTARPRRWAASTCWSPTRRAA